eukprot:TRINITY_DN47541_c0_g3_i1.p1 TRINITY_DN47541_c0_g3~~TRINITY_DN47541_c0_g3_i1.p1  ORF type:complete len:840 (-),score=144.51 TRINITY_DN47541_c0_g3_i1:363-2882(-)
MKPSSAGAVAALCLFLLWSSSESPLGGERDFGRRLRHGGKAGKPAAELEVPDKKESEPAEERHGDKAGKPAAELEVADKKEPEPAEDDNQKTVAPNGPPLPNLVKLVLHRSFEMVRPLPWLPKLDDLTHQELIQRRDYFVTAGFLMVSTFMALGVGLTVVGSKAVSSGQMVLLPSTSRPVESELGEVKRQLLQVSVRVHFLAICGMLFFCLQRESFSSQYGAAWEFWLVWLAVCLTQGLIEMVAVLRRGERRAMSVYPVKMIVGHLPFLSEKADTVKDVIFCALALHAGDVYLAGFSFAMLVLCHELFLQSREVEGDLYEAYLPVLSSPPPLSEEEAAVPSAVESQTIASANADTRIATVDKAPGFSQALETLLKQTSAGRLRIAMMEDLPQAMLAVLFVFRNGDCKYVSGSFSLSLIRIVPSLPAVARAVTEAVFEKIHREVVKSARAGNAARLHGQLTRLVRTEKTSPWDVRKFSMAERLWVLMASLLLSYFAYAMTMASLTSTKRIIVGVLTVVSVVLMLVATQRAKVAHEDNQKDRCCRTDACGRLVFWSLVVLCLCAGSVIVSAAMSIGMHTWLPIKALALGSVVVAILMDIIIWTPSSMETGLSGTRFNREKVHLIDLELMVRLLKEVPCTLVELKDFGFGPIELKSAYPAPVEALIKLFKPEEVLMAFSIQEVLAGGLTPEQLAASGTTFEDLVRSCGLKAVWELKSTKSTVDTFNSYRQRIVNKYEPAEIREAGIPCSELAKCRLPEGKIAAFAEAGYTGEELYQMKFTEKAMKEAGFTLTQLKEAGYGSNLASLHKLKYLGFSAKDFKAAGFSSSEMMQAGFGFLDRKIA